MTEYNWDNYDWKNMRERTPEEAEQESLRRLNEFLARKGMEPYVPPPKPKPAPRVKRYESELERAHKKRWDN